MKLTEETNTRPSGRRARSSEPFAEMIVTEKYFVIILFIASLFMQENKKTEPANASAKHAGMRGWRGEGWGAVMFISVPTPTMDSRRLDWKTTSRHRFQHGQKEQSEGRQAINVGCLAPHIRHLFVSNFHYNGNIRRHLEVRNNQSAMRNQPT